MTNRHEVDRKLSETCKAPCPAPRRAIGKRIVILALFVGAVIAFFAFDLDRYVNIETLRENRIWLKNFVAENTLLAALIFMAVYAVATAFSLPGGTVLSIAGGFLFGLWLGCLLVVTAATIGAGSTITRDAPAGELTLSRAKQTTISGWQRPRKKEQ